MPSPEPVVRGRSSTLRAVQHHLALVLSLFVLGAVAGLLYAGTMSTTYTATARVLVNPSVGNPFVPSPSAVRQDELTSLETEAQVARSAEVLQAVLQHHPTITPGVLERGLQIVVPVNTQILDISYTAGDAAQAEQVANEVATFYLANRTQRFETVNNARIDRLGTQAAGVVKDLRGASFASHQGTQANRAFHAQLASALRNELVNLRAQRTALENSDAPAGTVISPATTPHSGTNLLAIAAPVGGAVAGLGLGCLVAALMERLFGVIRSPREVEETGMPVGAAVPRRSLSSRILRRGRADAFDTTIRRLRASILELDPRPDIITVAPPGGQLPDVDVSESVAQSFARAGHRVVLVRTDASQSAGGLEVEDGLAQALMFDRLNVQDLLVPSVDPLLSLLPGGDFTAQSREFITATRVRDSLSPLAEAGNLVVIQAPGLGSVEGEAYAGAADLCLVVVTARKTRVAAVWEVIARALTKGTPLAAVVVGRRDAARRTRLASHRPDHDHGSAEETTTVTRRRWLSRSS